MSSTGNTSYSSTALRARDQGIFDKHEKEKAILERKIQRLQHAQDQTKKQLFDAVHRTERIAQSLGFEDVYQAQVAIDSADYDISYRECFESIQVLEAQLEKQRKTLEPLQLRLRALEADNRDLQERVQEAEDEVLRLKTELERVKSEKTLAEARYDEIKAVKERAAERYKTDFKKWRDFSRWLFGEDEERRKQRNEPGITVEEKKRRDKASLMRKRQMMIELGPDLARFEGEPDDQEDTTTARHPPPIGRTEMECDKENEGTPVPPQKRKLVLSESGSTNTTPPILLRDTLLKSVTNLTAPSSSPTIFLSPSRPNATNSTRAPLSFKLIPDTIQVDAEPSSTPSPLNSTSFRRSLLHLPSSSDTEDDSQAVVVPSTNSRSGRPAVFKVPAAPPSIKRSDADSPRKSLTPSLPARPSFAQDARPAPNLFITERIRPRGSDQENDRPSKIRRLSGNDAETSSSSSRVSLIDYSFGTRKGKERENEASTPLASAQKRQGDYSAFKGRGRYGKGADGVDTTINALYTIDPTNNGGKNYQYDAVVRNKDERRKMDADDCECCHEYYKTVGPLPSRLQQPLWRSPPPTPAKPCPRHSHSPETASARRDAEIDSHKKAISRHRQTWARANTPPGYWEIGFPNTQEVGDINEKAKEMHLRKKDEVAREALREGGKYRRR